MTSAHHSTHKTIWAVFTKPWPLHTAQQLSDVVLQLGFNGVEIPVRNNTLITPDNAATLLPRYVSDMAERGITTISIATELTEPIFAACREAGVDLIRIMIPVTTNDYSSSVTAARIRLEKAADWARNYDVGVVIQPHRGEYVSSCFGVLDIIKDLPGEYFKVAWDAAHDALAGDDPVTAMNACGGRLAIANFKNVIYQAQAPDPQHPGTTLWKPWYVPGPEGLADWNRAITHLRQRPDSVPLCFTAQYSSTSETVEDLLRRDVKFAQELWDSNKEGEKRS
ncbi:sugar phosphate isomerase/epimerase [Arthrobacter sp. 18067]|uniref:sugar phosphate isomerase/epimerase family protein n=1 Tax=Arthrobacter sp. 18067 TaxID=2681413 RepID=UPI001356B9C8|nr:sugar phosphate isomerase/epimerase [Arthrobacter sp. 18067]